MVDGSEIALLSATEQRRLIDKQALSPSELTEACLQQILHYNNTLNALVTLNERAIEDAKLLETRAAGGEEVGPLYGLTVGIKDTTIVAGMRTTFGSRLYADHVPEHDALVVRRLKKAGAIILGKTNCPEFAAGGNTLNEVFGATRNPWNIELSAGGSTGGGATALAAGMLGFAEGTDLGGSLRIPASFCGIVGLRPSPGLVPTYPSDYLWDTLSVTGPMARTAEDLALFLQAVAGPSPLCPITQPLAGRDFMDAVHAGISKQTRIAYCKDVSGIGVDETIENVCLHAALEMTQLQVEVREIEFDLSLARKVFPVLRAHWFLSHHRHRLNQLAELSSNVSGNIEAGLKLTMEELAAAEQARGQIRRLFHDFFKKFDFLLTPCMAVPPFPVEQNYPETVAGKKMTTYIDWLAPTYVFSLTGLPVASVPCGLDPNGLPVGLQIVGKPFAEGPVLALAKQIQLACPIGLPPLSEL